jgi:MFS family permease
MSTPTATAGPGRAPGGADPRRWVALAVVLIAGFMQLVDISIVNVAIPSIQRDLDATYAEIQWVLAGYQLAFAVMLITGGRLGDIFGRKRLFMVGMAGFTPSTSRPWSTWTCSANGRSSPGCCWPASSSWASRRSSSPSRCGSRSASGSARSTPA